MPNNDAKTNSFKVNLLKIGLSSGALDKTNYQKSQTLSTELKLPALELSALHENELPALQKYLKDNEEKLKHFTLSIHGPAKGRELTEEKLTAALYDFNQPIIMHPEFITEMQHWTKLKNNLYIENNDNRKNFGQTSKDLNKLFEKLPEANFCLDIPHALSVGGEEHALNLAEEYKHKLQEIHVGCRCGKPEPADLPKETLNCLSAILQKKYNKNITIICEREGNQKSLHGNLEQLKTLINLQ